MKMVLKKISGLIIMLCYGFAMIILGIVIHETIHYFDVKDNINISVKNICFINYDFNTNFWDMRGGYMNIESEEDESFPSELKAYIFSFVVVILLSINLGYFLFKEDKEIEV